MQSSSVTSNSPSYVSSFTPVKKAIVALVASVAVTIFSSVAYAAVENYSPEASLLFGCLTIVGMFSTLVSAAVLKILLGGSSSSTVTRVYVPSGSHSSYNWHSTSSSNLYPSTFSSLGNPVRSSSSHTGGGDWNSLRPQSKAPGGGVTCSVSGSGTGNPQRSSSSTGSGWGLTSSKPNLSMVSSSDGFASLRSSSTGGGGGRFPVGPSGTGNSVRKT